ncbi:MAG: zinc ABC transporter substrate-binding protein [Granulosicoccus sp.]
MISVRITVLVFTTLALSAGSGYGKAAALTIVADTPVTQSLVTMVMDGTGNLPKVLMPGGASPHGYAMRPSDASLLQSADLVVWTSGILTPWLERAIQSLSDEPRTLELMSVEGTTTLPLRVDADFRYWLDATGDKTLDNTQQTLVDPHGWLDPLNAKTWLSDISAQLTQLDPENKQLYAQNTRRAEATLLNLHDEIAHQLSILEEQPFIVFHDSYHYFESRYKLNSIGAVSLSDASRPGIRHIRQLRRLLSDYSNACVFNEPQYSNKLVVTVTQGLSARYGTLDPLGASLAPGPELYIQLIKAMADEFTQCFHSK